MKFLQLQNQNPENHENVIIKRQNYENHELLIIPCQNNENHGKLSFDVGITKIMQYFEFFARITKTMKI